MDIILLVEQLYQDVNNINIVSFNLQVMPSNHWISHFDKQISTCFKNLLSGVRRFLPDVCIYWEGKIAKGRPAKNQF